MHPPAQPAALSWHTPRASLQQEAVSLCVRSRPLTPHAMQTGRACTAGGQHQAWAGRLYTSSLELACRMCHQMAFHGLPSCVSCWLPAPTSSLQDLFMVLHACMHPALADCLTISCGKLQSREYHGTFSTVINANRHHCYCSCTHVSAIVHATPTRQGRTWRADTPRCPTPQSQR